MTNLTWLGLYGNQITDISALAGLIKLTELDLKQNPLSASSINDHIPALQDRGITVAFDPTSETVTDDDPTPETIPDDPTPVTATDDPTPVTIPDGNLRAAIAAALDKASGATITKGEMTTLLRLGLDADDAGIRDLTGLEFATNLTSLSLNHNNISDIAPLRELTNLTRLELLRNQIKSIAPLRELTNLTWLNLNYNNISDIAPLRELTKLEELYLHDNNISDIALLRELTNLRVLSLGNQIKSIAPLRELTKLTWLQSLYSNISDISALSGLTNLETLYLHANDISDVSPLRGLTNLETLGLIQNDISDVSPLRGLTNLTWLALHVNRITDISALAGLTNLKALQLTHNNISDVSPLRGLTNLTFLTLAYNNVSDVSPLRGLIKLELLQLKGNPLNTPSINDHIPALQSSGATVSFDPFHEGDFDIELVFLDQFTGAEKNVLRAAARRWMSVITEDLPDYEFTQGWSGECGDESFRIPSGERIDDLRIYVTSFDGGGDVLGWGSPRVFRESHLPVLGCMGFDLLRANLRITGLHEIGHVLGFGRVWRNLDLLRDPNGDPHFAGPQAIAAFNDAGGRNYTGKKVPVQEDGVHWRGSLLNGDLMVPWGGGSLSAITVESLADLGYGVNVTQADAYTLPSAKASAKISAARPSIYGVDVTQADAYTLSDPDLHGQGRIAEGLSLMPGSTERDFDFDLRDNRLIGRLAPHPQAEPKPLCGFHLRREPIHVVDPQGRIVRTITP